jgi:hypothetical protein
VADLQILRRDLAVYLTTIVRILNAPVHPFDYAAAVEEMAEAVAGYQRASAGEADFTTLLDELADLAQAIRNWRTDTDVRIGNGHGTGAERRQVNATLRQIARLLVPLNYARGERFDHDPALKFGPVPRLEAAASLPSAPAELKPFIKVGLVREVNKVQATLRAARRLLG